MHRTSLQLRRAVVAAAVAAVVIALVALSLDVVGSDALAPDAAAPVAALADAPASAPGVVMFSGPSPGDRARAERPSDRRDRRGIRRFGAEPGVPGLARAGVARHGIAPSLLLLLAALLPLPLVGSRLASRR
jgi:hypothetical protein